MGNPNLNPTQAIKIQEEEASSPAHKDEGSGESAGKTGGAVRVVVWWWVSQAAAVPGPTSRSKKGTISRPHRALMGSRESDPGQRVVDASSLLSKWALSPQPCSWGPPCSQPCPCFCSLPCPCLHPCPCCSLWPWASALAQPPAPVPTRTRRPRHPGSAERWIFLGDFPTPVWGRRGKRLLPGLPHLQC